MRLSWTLKCWDEYQYWQNQDKRTRNKINELIKDIMRNGAMNGAGKPEKLKHRQGYSRRIDEANRLIYDITDDELLIISCKGHYED